MSITIELFYIYNLSWIDNTRFSFPIVYLNKNEVVSVIDSSNHFLNVSDFNNLLDIYEVKENE